MHRFLKNSINNEINTIRVIRIPWLPFGGNHRSVFDEENPHLDLSVWSGTIWWIECLFWLRFPNKTFYCWWVLVMISLNISRKLYRKVTLGIYSVEVLYATDECLMYITLSILSQVNGTVTMYFGRPMSRRRDTFDRHTSSVVHDDYCFVIQKRIVFRYLHTKCINNLVNGRRFTYFNLIKKKKKNNFY